MPARPAIPQERVDESRNIVERFMIRWQGDPHPRHVKAVDAYWTSAAEHGMNASTFTARVIASTGADVAASEDKTGAASQGGDWQLEFRSGTIDAPVLVSMPEQGEWDHLLATFTVTTAADAGAGSLRTAITNANAAGTNDSIVFNPHACPFLRSSSVQTIGFQSSARIRRAPALATSTRLPPGS